MKTKTKRVIAFFLISLVFIPTLLYARQEVNGKSLVLKRIQVSPKTISVPKGTDEETFKSLLQVKAIYKGDTVPQVIKDYTSNYSEIKDEVGSHKVEIYYVVNTYTAKAKVCVNIVETVITGEVDTQKQFPYVSGYEDNTFRPNQLVTREEVATMIARLLTDDHVPSTQNTVPDLNPERYSTSSINYVIRLNIIAPYIDGSFKSKALVTWIEFNDIIDHLKVYVGNQEVKNTKETGDVTRAEAIMVFNELFGREAINESVENPYTDLKAENPAYRDILSASVSKEH